MVIGTYTHLHGCFRVLSDEWTFSEWERKDEVAPFSLLLSILLPPPSASASQMVELQVNKTSLELVYFLWK
jgi:hypothetical protein